MGLREVAHSWVEGCSMFVLDEHVEHEVQGGASTLMEIVEVRDVTEEVSPLWVVIETVEYILYRGLFVFYSRER